MRPSHKQHVGLLPDDVSRGPKLSKSLSCVASLDSAQPLSSYHIDALASRLSPHPRTSDVTIPRHVFYGVEVVSSGHVDMEDIVLNPDSRVCRSVVCLYVYGF